MIKIYTYANPYEIDKESFWPEIQNCPQFCVSQTMVNGMEATYKIFKEQKQLTTIRNLVNALYKNWESDNTRISQMMEVDNAIHILSEQEQFEENILRSLEYNESALVKSIRMFQELGLERMPFTTTDLNLDQSYLVKIYMQVLQRPTTSFAFSHVLDEKGINAGIEAALKEKHDDINMSILNHDAIVLHGIHQFTPAMLCAIEDIGKFKTVILLFNYQEQYKAVYQTWLNIYNLFEQPIRPDATHQFHPMRLMVDSYASNLLADRMGKLAEGEYDGTGENEPIEVIEFANITEFAGYAASLFENAKQRQEQLGKGTSALSLMTEQLYAASGRVNDILRAYFPEQFGERHFLDYPLGHFFVSATCMWDMENQCTKVDSLSDIKECLECGIIAEERQGQHINSLNQVIPFIEKESTLRGVISKLKRLRKYVNRGEDDLKRVGYMAISKDDLNALITALDELDQIIYQFFSDFKNGGDNFRRFYQRIQDFISKRVADLDDLDDEMRVVIDMLLQRMNQSDLPDTGTFICLKQTMSYYLSQEDSLVKGAHWIVRDFEQIDGDILRSHHQKADETCYHFCCLSDKDICAAKDERLPWPLDIHFFEVACEPLDWKYQIFLKSKMEFRNFKRYALLYGLEFNHIGFKLSYVKTEQGKENDLFHLLTLLGAKIIPYREYRNRTPVQQLSVDLGRPLPELQLDTIDLIKWLMCPYRFALESLVQGQTVFRDRFLILNYMRALLVNRVRSALAGDRYSSAVLQQSLEEEYGKLADRFHILNELEKTQLIHESYKEIAGEARKKQWSRFPQIYDSYREGMDSREIFLQVFTEKNIEAKLGGPLPDAEEIKKLIDAEKDYYAKPSGYCTMCSSKDICLKRMKEKF